MNTTFSKAFLLGRFLYLRRVITEGDDSDNARLVKSAVKNFARALGVRLPKMSASDSWEQFLQQLESVKFDISSLQSEAASSSFWLGYHLTTYVDSKGAYSTGDDVEFDHDEFEGSLRELSAQIGLSQKYLDAIIEAAKDQEMDYQGFRELVDLRLIPAMGEELDAIARGDVVAGKGPFSNRVFVVMGMGENDPAVEDVLEAVRQAAAALELTAYRVDELDDTGRITDAIVEGLRKAAFVVVDLSNPRPNIYWEAGFAHGLGKTPIYIARKGSDIAFDIKDYPVIFYTSMKMLRERLGSRLKKASGKP